MTVRERRLLAGDAVDVVVPAGSGRAYASVRRRAAVAPCDWERCGPFRALPVTAIAHAPGIALLVRGTLPCAAMLDARALFERVGRIGIPGALAEALVPTLRVAEMDREEGGLRWAASDSASGGGLVSGTPLGAVPRAVRDALAERLGSALTGCLRIGLSVPDAQAEWAERLRSGAARHPRSLVLPPGDALAVSLDLGAGTVGIAGPGGASVAKVTVLDAALGRAAHRGARDQFVIPSAEERLALDLGALVSLLRVASLRALLLAWHASLETSADPGARCGAMRTHLEALVVGAVHRAPPRWARGIPSPQHTRERGRKPGGVDGGRATEKAASPNGPNGRDDA